MHALHYIFSEAGVDKHLSWVSESGVQIDDEVKTLKDVIGDT